MKRFFAWSAAPLSSAVRFSAIVGLSILFLCPVPLARADEEAAFVSLRRHQEAGVDVRILHIADGYIVDASLADNLEDLSVNISSGPVDLTEVAEYGEAVTSIVYVFAGGGESAQCKTKWALDTMLGQTGNPNPAFSDKPNGLCPELGFAGTYDDWPAFVDAGDGYQRVLAIEVREQGDAAVFEESDPLIWARLPVIYDDLDDRAALTRRLADFVVPRQTGFVSFVPFPAGNDGAPITITFYNNDIELFAVSSALPFLERIAEMSLDDLGFESLGREEKVALGGIAAGLAVALLIFVLHRRRMKLLRGRTDGAPSEASGGVPAKAVRIGYGKAVDYSLGEGPDREIALVEAYGDGRRRIVRLDRLERIEVDGANIGESTWVRDGAPIRIGRKKIVLS